MTDDEYCAAVETKAYYFLVECIIDDSILGEGYDDC